MNIPGKDYIWAIFPGPLTINGIGGIEGIDGNSDGDREEAVVAADRGSSGRGF